MEDNWENNEFDDSLDDEYEDEYDNDRRAVNETTPFDDYEDDILDDYYELPLQSATVGNNERHLAVDHQHLPRTLTQKQSYAIYD